MPRQIPYIIGNEACERFSFYGMRNILVPFLITSLLLYLPEAERAGAAKDVFHTFVIGVYFFPLLGGWIWPTASSASTTPCCGFSLLYCVGHACLAVFEDNRTGFYTGLFLIALGSGGIKPLVAAFMSATSSTRATRRWPRWSSTPSTGSSTSARSSPPC
jgi:POT family proton-dependent oligopeptide transporter